MPSADRDTSVISASHPKMSSASFSPAAPLLFVINSAAGALDIDAKRAAIESMLAAQGASR